MLTKCLIYELKHVPQNNSSCTAGLSISIYLFQYNKSLSSEVAWQRFINSPDLRVKNSEVALLGSQEVAINCQLQLGHLTACLELDSGCPGRLLHMTSGWRLTSQIRRISRTVHVSTFSQNNLRVEAEWCFYELVF